MKKIEELKEEIQNYCTVKEIRDLEDNELVKEIREEIESNWEDKIDERIFIIIFINDNQMEVPESSLYKNRINDDRYSYKVGKDRYEF